MQNKLLLTRLLLLFLVLSFQFMSNAKAQGITVTGRVTSDEDATLPGVTIVVKGTAQGTVTNVDGDYSLQVPNGNETLIFSSIGFKTQEVQVNGRAEIGVVLETDIQALEEVVVVGYTSKQVTELSSSVSVVSGEKLRDVTSNDVTSMLQGKAPGVIVSSSSGNPNSSPNIMIRGSSSITAGSDPLYVVDGIIGGTANPNDIESITVLKDAAATGLYGSRASNGVIVITTKKGQSGKTRVTLSSTTGFNEASFGNFRVMNSQQLYDYHKSFWNPANLDRDRPISLLSQTTDWMDLAFRTGSTQNYLLSLSGGTDKTQMYVSGNYFKEKGTVQHSGNEVFNIRTNVTHNINDKLKLSVKVNAGFRKTEDEASGNYGAMIGATRNVPWDIPYNADGTIKMGTEPGWIGRENDNFLHGWQYNFDKSRRARLDGDINLDYFITPHLTFSSYNRAGYNNSKRELYYDKRAKAGVGLGRLTNDFDFSSNLITSNRLMFEKSFDRHSFNTIVVAEAEKNFSDENRMLGQRLVGGLHVLGTASEILSSGSANGDVSENAFSKGLVQVDYNFDNRYFAVGSYIVESSSRFGADNRVGNFYTLGTSWILSNESFMSGSKQLDLVKVRASVGSTGNAQISDYQTLGLFSFSNQYGGNSASVPSQVANPVLTWEKALTVNVGLDIRLYRRISMNIDVYNKTSDALLLDVPLPFTSGYTSITRNVGSVQNKGLEINLNTQNLKGAFTWETNFNIAFNKNEVLKLNAGKDIIFTRTNISVGHDMNSWYMRKWAGVDPATGDPLWEVVNTDANGNKEVTTTNILANGTLQFVGTFTPDFTGGINNTFSYKAFTLSAFLNFVSGNLVYNESRENFDSDGAYETVNMMVLPDGWNRWEKPGDVATHPRPVFGGNLNSQRLSSRYLEDGSYIRLRNIKLAYELPAGFLSKIKIQSARVFISGDNLWTGTKFSGMDPEASYGLGGGSQYARYPISKRVLFGVNIEI